MTSSFVIERDAKVKEKETENSKGRGTVDDVITHHDYDIIYEETEQVTNNEKKMKLTMLMMTSSFVVMTSYHTELHEALAHKPASNVLLTAQNRFLVVPEKEKKNSMKTQKKLPNMVHTLNFLITFTFLNFIEFFWRKR